MGWHLKTAKQALNGVPWAVDGISGPDNSLLDYFSQLKNNFFQANETIFTPDKCCHLKLSTQRIEPNSDQIEDILTQVKDTLYLSLNRRAKCYQWMESKLSRNLTDGHFSTVTFKFVETLWLISFFQPAWRHVIINYFEILILTSWKKFPPANFHRWRVDARRRKSWAWP